jgi:DNA-binding transcriptional ArsR family regulator
MVNFALAPPTGKRLAQPASAWQILNPMVQYQAASLSSSFAALADSTRRGVLERLGRREASITDLADAFRMSLTGMKKHVAILEQAGFVATEKVGRVRTCRLGHKRMAAEAEWIERYRQRWDARFAALDAIVSDMTREENTDESKA